MPVSASAISENDRTKNVYQEYVLIVSSPFTLVISDVVNLSFHKFNMKNSLLIIIMPYKVNTMCFRDITKFVASWGGGGEDRTKTTMLH